MRKAVDTVLYTNPSIKPKSIWLKLSLNIFLVIIIELLANTKRGKLLIFRKIL